MDAPLYVNQKQYAKLKGVAQQTINEAVRNGQLSLEEHQGKKLLHVPTADREWTENFATHAPKSSTYSDARAERERFNAKMSRLKFEEKSGSLVERAVVEREAFKLGRILRESLLSLPERIGPILAAVQSVPETIDLLEKEIVRCLSELAAVNSETEESEDLTEEGKKGGPDRYVRKSLRRNQ